MIPLWVQALGALGGLGAIALGLGRMLYSAGAYWNATGRTVDRLADPAPGEDGR